MINLAEIDWVSVPCDKKVLNNIMCTMDVNIINQTNIINSQKSPICKQNDIVVDKKCYLLLWNEKENFKSDSCKIHKTRLENSKLFARFQTIFDAIPLSSDFPLIFMGGIKDDDNVLKYNSYTKTFEEFQSNSEQKGYSICRRKKVDVIVGTNLFPCLNGGYILHYYFCDGKVDCPNDNSDENACNCLDPKADLFIVNITQIKSIDVHNYTS